MALQRTFTLDFVKQEFSTSGIVSRQGEYGELITFNAYANGQPMTNISGTSKAKLKGITADDKYVEIKGTVQTGGIPRLTFQTTQDWNSAAGNFKIAYVELIADVVTQTSTVNIDWFVLPEANPTGKDIAHYVNELQKIIDELQEKANQYMDDLQAQFTDAEEKLVILNQDIKNAQTELQKVINETSTEWQNKVNIIGAQMEFLDQTVKDALAQFEAGDFYSKSESDERFMKKGEAPTDVQVFKLTKDDGTFKPLPDEVTSFTKLADYTGYFYVTQAQALQMEDQGSLPIMFQSSGLFVFMPVGNAKNAYRYQEIRLNSTVSSAMAFRNTNATSTTPWQVVATGTDISTINSSIETINNQVTVNTGKITALETPKYWKGYFNVGNNIEPVRHRSRMGWGTLLTTQAELDGLQPMDVPFTIERLFLTAKRDIKFILKGVFYLQGSGGANPRWAYAHARINTDGGEATGTATPMGGVQNGASGVQWKNWAPFQAVLTMKAGEKLAFSVDVDETQTGKQIDRGHIEAFYIQEVPNTSATLEARSYALDHKGFMNV